MKITISNSLKKERAAVYDYVDVNIGVLRAAAKARARVYSGQAK